MPRKFYLTEKNLKFVGNILNTSGNFALIHNKTLDIGSYQLIKRTLLLADILNRMDSATSSLIGMYAVLVYQCKHFATIIVPKIPSGYFPELFFFNTYRNASQVFYKIPSDFFRTIVLTIPFKSLFLDFQQHYSHFFRRFFRYYSQSLLWDFSQSIFCILYKDIFMELLPGSPQESS